MTGVQTCALPISVDLKDVAAHPVILRERGSATRELVEREMARRRVTPRIAMEIDSSEAIKRAVEGGLGVGILSAVIARREVAEGTLRAIRIHGTPPRRVIHLAYHVERHDSPLLRAVLRTAATLSTEARATARRAGRTGKSARSR